MMFGASSKLGMCSVKGFYGRVPLGIFACRTTRGLSHLVRVAQLLLVSTVDGWLFHIYYYFDMAILHARVPDAALSFGIARLMGRKHMLTHISYGGASSWSHNMLSICAHKLDIILALRVVHGINTIICYV